MRPLLFAALLLPLSSALRASPEEPFVSVMVDSKTEAELGPFPYDRSVYAKAILALKRNGARAAVLKFFLDQPKTEAGDAELERAMKELPTFLEARMLDSEPHPNGLSKRSFIKRADGGFGHSLSGKSGWIPLPRFEAAAAGVGFVDVRSTYGPVNLPVVESYKGKPVPSLYLSVLAFESGDEPRVVDGRSVTLGGSMLRLDERNEVDISLPGADSLASISLADLLDGRTPPESLRGKIAVLGYDGDRQGGFETAIGRIRAHRMFYYCLLDLYSKFREGLLPIHALKAASTAPGEYLTEGFVIGTYVCPPCPAGAMCKPCDKTNFVLYEDWPTGRIAQDKQLKLYCEDELLKRLKVGRKAVFRVRVSANGRRFELMDMVK